MEQELTGAITPDEVAELDQYLARSANLKPGDLVEYVPPHGDQPIVGRITSIRDGKAMIWGRPFSLHHLSWLPTQDEIEAAKPRQPRSDHQ